MFKTCYPSVLTERRQEEREKNQALKKYSLNFRHTLIILFLCFLGFAGCSKKNTQFISGLSGNIDLSSHINDVIQQISLESSPARENLTIQSAEFYLKQNEFEKCQQLLDTLYPRELPPTLKSQYIIILSKKSIRNQQSEVALQALTTNQLGLFDIIDQLDKTTQIIISELRADAYEASGNFLAAARERIFFGPLLIDETDSSQADNRITDLPVSSNDTTGEITSPRLADANFDGPIQRNNEAIWRNLMAVPKVQLSKLAVTALGEDYRGWLELAYLNKAYQDDLDIQTSKLSDWIQHWPHHIATKHLPGFLRALQLAAESRPRHVALLLPSSGKFKKAAKAIQEGFLSAHYTSINRPNKSRTQTQDLQLSLYDTSNFETIKQVYDFAVENGAEMIIGPLKKGNVALLKMESDLAVPILALNYAGDDNPASQHFFQFGLRTEDEVKQVADRAWMDGRKQAAILFPETEWGFRVEKAFVDYWLELGGHVVAQSGFTGKNDYSDAIKIMLNIEQSEQRATGIRALLREKIEFNPRRRQDIDFIFLLSSPAQARQIKPTLDFHYAADLPVFATSNIYEGHSNADRDKDINGIQFVDIPWILTDDDEIKTESQPIWNNSNDTLQRLYALGVDAYRLVPRLQLMRAVPNGSLFGATGTLSLVKSQRIERKLLWAKIQRGVPELMAIKLDTTTQPISLPRINSENNKGIPASVSTP